MTSSTRVTRRPRLNSARAAVAIIVTSALALLAAGCGANPGSAGAGGSSNAGASTNSQANTQILHFTNCMRSNGVPNFPDPGNDVKFPSPQQLGVSQSQFNTAYSTCKHLLPNNGGASSQSELDQQRSALLPFASCMRSHGVSNWPDPSIQSYPSGTSIVVFDLRGLQGLDGNGITSPQVQGAVHKCQHLLPPHPGGPPFRITRGPHRPSGS
jgi:hypothetical protein